MSIYLFRLYITGYLLKYQIKLILGSDFLKIKLNEMAIEELKKIQVPEKQAIRLSVTGFGWSGPSFGMTLDESNDDDTTVEVEGLKFLVENDFATHYDGFNIEFVDDYRGRGFAVSPLGIEESSCSSCSSCGWFWLSKVYFL